MLNTNQTQQLLASKKITLIRADWTNKNQTVTNLLKKYNQISIPTYIYFNGSKHKVFGDILTYEKLKENLDD